MWPILVVSARLKIQLSLAKSLVAQLVDTSKRCLPIELRLRGVNESPQPQLLNYQPKKKKKIQLSLFSYDENVNQVTSKAADTKPNLFCSQAMEEDDHKSDICGSCFYKKTPEV